MVKVSVIIKALNEEAHIARAIESALRAVASVGGEVILADSLSTDSTVEIARGYPIGIAQLLHPQDRCCGIGAQLGFQYAKGEFVYILDGDMELQPGFLEQALIQMAQDPTLAGIGGRVRECNLQSLEYQARQERAPVNLQAGYVDRLDMGGLYRRSALEQVGFFTNQNLHAYEEFDLAVRLRALNYRLYRLDIHAVDHHGHTLPAYLLLRKRWHNRYLCGVGEVLRGAMGQPHLRLVLADLREFWLYLSVMGWWLVLAGLVLGGWPLAALALLALPVVGMVVKKRSLLQGCYSVVSWNLYAAATLRGFLATPKSPSSPVAAQLLLVPPLSSPAA